MTLPNTKRKCYDCDSYTMKDLHCKKCHIHKPKQEVEEVKL